MKYSFLFAGFLMYNCDKGWLIKYLIRFCFQSGKNVLPLFFLINQHAILIDLAFIAMRRYLCGFPRLHPVVIQPINIGSARHTTIIHRLQMPHL